MKTAAGGWRPAALCVLLLALAAAAEFTRLSSRTVTTKYGALKGYIETPVPPGTQGQQSSRQQQLQPVEVFLGVPYAAPPTGAMRFMPPVSPAHWSGVRMADRLAPVCPQRLPDIGSESEAVKRMPLGRLEYLRRLLPHLQRHSEDCLYLNIYTPAIGQSCIRCVCACAFEPACLLCATAISLFFLAILSRLRVGGAHRRGDGLIRAPAEEESSYKRSR
ncbi:hypothetical protein HPB51_011951 [Rhipicephalus microplus]|uniref:Carboxylesterase type B domain-containing protein n=1 Tax=Rhipicephalus microplus TaxID=6941 RepID=A0A9J6F2F2_RHIMP|nr:hypothetical protein HPB51_011951 [Rhipicephalus microplus]